MAVPLWLLQPFWQLTGQFGARPEVQPSRLYGQPLELAVGTWFTPQALLAELQELGYHETTAGETFSPGRFERRGDSFEVWLRAFPTLDGAGGRVRVTISFAGRRVQELRVNGVAVKQLELEPPLLASLYDDRLLERRPVRLEEVPQHLIDAVVAAEDASFFRHRGISPRGIARAAWVNLRAGAVRQGGSTLTQQLAWNLYLTHERTVSRKVREATLALLIDARFEKREILEAYLNVIYLGRSGPVSLLGFGAAARAYLAKDLRDVTLEESALLAGMVPNPAQYNPVRNPPAARVRRDWVLERMVETGTLDRAAADAAKAIEPRVASLPVAYRRAPYFADAMAEEATRRYGVARLADSGYTLLSTLSWRDQERAEEAVEWGLDALEKGWEKDQTSQEGRLQASLVSLDPKSGALLAYVGGRDYGESQFDRAGGSRRQAGSAFKPVVYAAAFEDGVASPSTLLDDAPLQMQLASSTWTPQNDDAKFRGWVTARSAMEKSLNVPTAKLAVATGLPRIVRLAEAMGAGTALEPYPSLALGAFEISAVELGTVYATLAAGGNRPTPHGLRAVLDPRGEPVRGEEVELPRRVLSAQSAYLVTSLLQGVLDRGTGASLRGQGVRDALAGKTGTTNGRRDSWFAGYAPTRATVVWVGYDDNSSTRLSGARAALPIWGRFMSQVRPASGYPLVPRPPGVVTAVVDPETGELATERCPVVSTEVFVQASLPRAVCWMHRGAFVDAAGASAIGATVEQPQSGVRTWLRRVFGTKDGAARSGDRSGPAPRSGTRPRQRDPGPPPGPPP